jgi:hypothetical protein
MTNVIDLEKVKTRNRWNNVCDEFEKKLDEEAANNILSEVEANGYRKLKRFIRILKEREDEE